ncbi:NADH-ubiquinone oxidoreductase-F iron-sulfur binding region domain-containing protein [Sorangium sp. So ce854]|uniref:NADH-ubiquinone oxidoreductase-F iron-sulfur binding region domain-containing protein n=1 Tax=Sorangium sp. So ce854 TaxID=3133322 RepID=UPI003F60074A
MTVWLRQYRRSHRAGERPLIELQAYLRASGAPDGEALRQLAERLDMPVAAVRSAISYYSELHERPDALRVCRGTSCALAGAERLGDALAASGPCRGVYCLGFCDRSPAVLLPDNRVATRCDPADASRALDAATPDPAPPAIRSACAEPIVTRNVLRGDTSELADARVAGVYAALEAALTRPAEEVLRCVERSGERGRGGAAYPTGAKWRRCAEAPGSEKYVVVNGDEGDPGSFIDRVLLEGDPHSVLEGMILCAYAVGADHGVVFIRSEYPRAIARMQRAIEQAYGAGILGPSVMGHPVRFDVEVFPGMGSYVCGEETALLGAIEGFRGDVRPRPPYPVESGLDGCPTLVNNVETLVNIPWIIARGGDAYRALGTRACPGTKALCLNHGFARPGIVEIALGMSLRRVIEEEAGGPRAGELIAVLLGGPMGSVVPPSRWDVPVCYQAMAERGIQLGHGGLVAVPADADGRALLLHWLEFMQRESCGKCVPCRVGSQRALTLAQGGGAASAPALERLLDVISAASLCAFGQLMPVPVRELVALFGDGVFGAERGGDG